MAGNVNSAPTSLTRLATRFRALIIAPRQNKESGATARDHVRLTVKAASGQAANIVEVTDSSDTVLFSINKDGQIVPTSATTTAVNGGLQYKTVTVSSAEILALFTTAKSLVAAPGAGKVIEFVRGTITYNHVATDYTVGSSTNLSVKYKDKTGADVSTTRATTGFIDGATAYSMFQPLTAQLALDTNAVNQPLVLALLVANPTGGDGTFTVNIVYRVHTL